MFGSRPNMTGNSSGMTEEKIILSLSGLTRQSRDPRVALRLPGDDIEEGSTGICKGDVRLKAEHNKEKRPNMTKNKAPLPRGFVYLLSSNGVLSRGLLWVRILMTLTSSFFNSSRVQTMSTIPCSFRYSAR